MPDRTDKHRDMKHLRRVTPQGQARLGASLITQVERAAKLIVEILFCSSPLKELKLAKQSQKYQPGPLLHKLLENRAALHLFGVESLPCLTPRSSGLKLLYYQ